VAEYRLAILRNFGIAILVAGLVLSGVFYVALTLSGSLAKSGSTGTNSENPTSSTSESRNTTANNTSSSVTTTQNSSSTSNSPMRVTSITSSTSTTYSSDRIYLNANITLTNETQFGPWTGIAYDSRDNVVYALRESVNNASQDFLVTINASSHHVISIVIVPYAKGLLFDSDDGLLYMITSNSISGYSPKLSQFVKNISIVDPASIGFDPSGNEIFVSNAANNSVPALSIINASAGSLQSVLTSESFPFPMYFSYDPVSHNMYAYGEQSYWIIDARSDQIIGNYSLPSPIMNMAIDPKNGNIYATIFGEGHIGGSLGYNGSLYVLSSLNGKLLANLTFPSSPYVMGIDSINDLLFVSNTSLTGGFSALRTSDYKIISNVSLSTQLRPDFPIQFAFDSTDDSMFMILGTSLLAYSG